MLALIGHTIQFLVFHALVRVVDRVSRLPRSGVQPKVERLLRENPALKAQVRALVLDLKSERGSRPRVSMRTWAAQVFAYLLTRGDKAFQNYYLSASRTTIERWATKLRRGPWPWRRKGKGGRPPLAQEIKDLIIELKSRSPLWGGARIKHELLRMGIKVSEPTIHKSPRPRPGAPRSPRRGPRRSPGQFLGTSGKGRSVAIGRVWDGPLRPPG